MASDNDLLKEIVETARDGADFYDGARQKVKNPRLRAIFGRMAAAKRELIADLSAHLAASGETAPKGGTLLGSFRKLYAETLATLATDDDQVYVAQLEEAEDRLLSQIDKAILEASATDVRVQLQAYLPKVRACHDEMRDLKDQLTA